MIHYRPFLNSDPPALAEIWRSQRPARGLIQMMTPAVLDDLVFSKPFFDRRGLIVAVEDDRCIGFAHAGFGPDQELAALDRSAGTTAMLLVAPHSEHETVARELLARSEQYLREEGATKLYGGATNMLAPFYLGLYSGSRLSGVLASDDASVKLFRDAGYTETPYARVLRADLIGFRQPMDRDLMQIRRQFQLEKQPDSAPQNWWEACELALLERLQFVLLPKSNGPPVAEAKFWDVEPLATSWGTRVMGLYSMQISPQPNDVAVATHLMGEIFRQFQGLGVTAAEFQLQHDETLAQEVSKRLGFREIDQGILFSKPTTS